MTNRGPLKWNLKFLECKDEINQQIELKERIKKMELKCNRKSSRNGVKKLSENI